MLNVAKRRVIELVRRHVRKRRFAAAAAGLPVTLNLAFNYKCRCSCPHCHFVQDGKFVFDTSVMLRRELLAAILAKKYARKLTAMGCGGGEALLHPDCFGLIDMARQRGIRDIQVVTNGLSLKEEEIVREVMATRMLTNLQISLDAANEEEYNRAKGISRSNFPLIAENIGRISRAASTTVVLSFVIHRGNFGQMPAMISIARELGVASCYFHTVQLISSKGAGVAQAEAGAYDAFIRDIMRKNDYGVDISIQPPLTAKNTCYYCRSLATCLGVGPTGVLAPCSHISWHEKYGSIGNDDSNPLLGDEMVKMRGMFMVARAQDDPNLLPETCRLCNRRLLGRYDFSRDSKRWRFVTL